MRPRQAEFGPAFPLHLGNAEAMSLPDAGFDLAISENGASIWCDPYRWNPMAARPTRPGGESIFLVNGDPLLLCTPTNARIGAPPTERLECPYFGLHWVD